jgi:hypothetical protein
MRRNHIILVLLIIISFIFGCAALKEMKSIPGRHEKIETKNPICSDCHEEGTSAGKKSFSAYNHTGSFYDRHGNAASGFSSLCESCHKQKFCSDCHGNVEEIVPSKKLGNRPDLSSPHRGDYFSKHKIEGRIKSTQCFKCHGRRNNTSCKACH